jgi:hypothetical protein
MTSTHLDVSARSRRPPTRVVAATPDDLRALRRVRTWFLPPFAVLSVAVVVSPIELHATFANDWNTFWQLTWLGFDAAVTGALVVAAVGAFRRSPWSEGAAAVAASVLASNATIDVTTAADTRHMILAAVVAVTLEAPLIALCLMIACPTKPPAQPAPVGDLST